MVRGQEVHVTPRGLHLLSCLPVWAGHGRGRWRGGGEPNSGLRMPGSPWVVCIPACCPEPLSQGSAPSKADSERGGATVTFLTFQRPHWAAERVETQTTVISAALPLPIVTPLSLSPSDAWRLLQPLQPTLGSPCPQLLPHWLWEPNNWLLCALSLTLLCSFARSILYCLQMSHNLGESWRFITLCTKLFLKIPTFDT